MADLPFQTYKKVTGQDWPGGKSKMVLFLLSVFEIGHEPGSAEANLELQRNLIEYWC